MEEPLNHEFGFVTWKTRGSPHGEAAETSRFLPSQMDPQCQAGRLTDLPSFADGKQFNDWETANFSKNFFCPFSILRASDFLGCGHRTSGVSLPLQMRLALPAQPERLENRFHLCERSCIRITAGHAQTLDVVFNIHPRSARLLAEYVRPNPLSSFPTVGAISDKRPRHIANILRELRQDKVNDKGGQRSS